MQEPHERRQDARLIEATLPPGRERGVVDALRSIYPAVDLRGDEFARLLDRLS